MSWGLGCRQHSGCEQSCSKAWTRLWVVTGQRSPAAQMAHQTAEARGHVTEWRFDLSAVPSRLRVSAEIGAQLPTGVEPFAGARPGCRRCPEHCRPQRPGAAVSEPGKLWRARAGGARLPTGEDEGQRLSSSALETIREDTHRSPHPRFCADATRSVPRSCQAPTGLLSDGSLSLLHAPRIAGLW